MQAGTFPTGAPVVDIRTRVLVNGVERTFESLTWDAEIPGDLPEGVAAGSGIKERTGTIVWAGDPVAVRSPGPWTRVGGWPPQRGDRVEIWDDCDGQSWRRFYGRIDSNTGALGFPASSKIVDDWDTLDREAYVEPMLQSMPGVPTSASASAPGYLSSLTAWGPVYRALESAGKGLAPAPSGAVLAASFQGGSVPVVGGVYERPGTLLTSSTYPGVQYHSDITIREVWDDRGTVSLPSLAILLRFPQADALGASGAAAQVSLALGTGTTVAVRCTAQTVTVSSGGATIAQVDAAYGTSDMCSVAVRWEGTRISIWQNGIETSMTASAALPSSHAILSARCVNLALVQVFKGVTASDWASKVAAVIPRPIESRVSAWAFRVLPASRMIVSKSAREVLEDFTACTLHSIWLDESGVLQVWGSDKLIRADIARTFTTSLDVLAMSWEESWDQARFAVNVKYLDTTITQFSTWSANVWQPGGSAQLAAGEVIETFIEPGTDEDWIEPDFTLESAADHLDDLNWNRGSLYGATITGQDSEAWGDGWVSVALNHVKGYTKKLRQQAWTTLPSNRVIQLGTPSEASGVLARWRGVPMPVIRARGLVTWTDMTARAQAGPAWASEYSHNLKHWGSASSAQELASWLAPQLSAPTVTLTSLDLAYDPRIQLADMIRVTSDREGFTVTGLVVGIHVGVDADGHGMSLTIRVTAVDHNGATYEQLEAAYAGVGETFQTLETDWSDTDYAGFESNPTGRQ